MIMIGKAELEALSTWISDLPDVTQAPHRFGGTEFQVQGLEFMHFHGYTHLDIRLSKEDQLRVLSEEKADHHMFAPQAGWVTFRIRSPEDIPRAREIIELAYENARTIVETQKARKAAQAGYQAF